MSVLRDKIDSMSNGALARLIGCTPAFASYLTRGQRSPSLALARKMAEKLGSTVEDVLDALREKRGKRKRGAGVATVTLREKAKGKRTRVTRVRQAA